MRKTISRFVLITLASSLFLTSTITVFATSEGAIIDSSEISEISRDVINQIVSLESRKIAVKDYSLLYDVSDNPSYVLLTFTEGGYAIVSRSNSLIAIYDLDSKHAPYEELPKTSKKVFGGPLNYFSVNSKGQLVETNTGSIYAKNQITTAMRNMNSDFLNQAKSIQLVTVESEIVYAATASWVGIPSSRVSRYSTGMWINSTTNYPASQGYPVLGICGTIAAAIMLAYFDDYIDNNYVPSTIRIVNSSTPGSLITTLYNYIDKGKNGTFPWDVSSGVNSWMMAYSPIYNLSHRSWYSTFTFSLAKDDISNMRPVAIGLLEMLGSTYEDHWVTAYQFQENGIFSTSYYKVVDNHGSYTATIHVNWTSGIVGLD
ncbi:MAG TPA: hypothetical protein DCQ90_01810 [Erysipelotrichaceae bacterium]|nr:hypothetical protein [Erysipelotrichaceae bacterium]